MSDILDLKTIYDYNQFHGFETQNSQVSFANFSKMEKCPHCRMRLGFYAVLLKDGIYGPLTYGRNKYDYEAGTLVFISSGQVIGIDDNGYTPHPQGYASFFHPDFIRGTSLAHKMKDYTFFSYEVNEALHMSERERQTVFNCFDEIKDELRHVMDKHSRSIIISNIEVLLNNCLRFYDRQFSTRSVLNGNVLSRFHTLLNNYFNSDSPKKLGLPSVAWCADQLHFSANYFGDMIKKQSGKSAIECIHQTVIDKVKDLLLETDKTISEIAYETGFKYPQHMTRLFKKIVGCAPKEYRENANT